jgi:hypothetical protein
MSRQMRWPSVRIAAVLLVMLGTSGRVFGQASLLASETRGKAGFWTPKGVLNVAQAMQQTATAQTIPMWNGDFVYQGVTYPYVMVGTDPSLGSATSRIPVSIIPLEFDLPGGVVLSASAPVCGGTSGAVQLTRRSPLFQASVFTAGSTLVGRTQYVDAFQRANFWNLVSSRSPRYHVKLGTPKVLPTQVISVPEGSAHLFRGPCGNYAIIDFGFYVGALLDIRSRLPQVTPTTLPILLTYNVFTTDPTGSFFAILGFHFALDFGAGLQTFISAAFTDPGIFDGVADITVLSHEIGEWMDDPLTTNPTPGWRFGGQCQSNLEVGDPVTGVTFPVTTGNFTYHPEDLVFLPWFARESPSPSVNGWYSFVNTYSSPPAVCSPSGAFLDAPRG